MLNRISIFLLSFLPISLILGNFAVNLNIYLISLFLLYHCYKTENWNWIKDDIFKLLIIFYFYLIINSAVFYYLESAKYNNADGLFRSLTFIKFIFLAYAFKLLVKEKYIFDNIFKFWCLIISVVIFDVFFESIFGHNILGYSSADHTRIVSFFRDETIVGALILCFGYVVATYFLSQNLTLKSKIFFNIFLLMVPLCILISGERSNFIKGSIIFFLILFFLNKTKILITKKKFVIAGIFILLSTLFFNQNVLYKQTEALKRVINVKNSEKFIDRFKSIHYIFHYNIAFEIFKDFPISGVGNKNFRLVACNDRKYINKAFDFNNQKSYIGCSTHPHQIHFELLAEHGLIGYFFFFYIMFIFLKKNLILFNSSNNIFVFTPAIYLLVFLIPLLPSGALFSTFSGTMFWVIFSIANLNLNKKYIG